MGSSKKITIGYKYYVGMHMIICHGPINEIDIIRAGDVNIYEAGTKEIEVSWGYEAEDIPPISDGDSYVKVGDSPNWEASVGGQDEYVYFSSIGEKPFEVLIDDSPAPEGTVGELLEGQWGWGYTPHDFTQSLVPSSEDRWESYNEEDSPDHIYYYASEKMYKKPDRLYEDGEQMQEVFSKEDLSPGRWMWGPKLGADNSDSSIQIIMYYTVFVILSNEQDPDDQEEHYIVASFEDIGMNLLYIRLSSDAMSLDPGDVPSSYIKYGAAEGGISSVYIDKPNAFGGKKKEGGVVGDVDVEFGGPNQGQNDYLQRHLYKEERETKKSESEEENVKGSSDKIPAFRGVVGIVLRQVYIAAMNPYIKQWSFRAKRIPDGGYNEIGHDMNPIGIIYDCLTNDEWGMGYPTSDMGESLTSTADGLPRKVLYDEEFGLSLLWSRSISIEEFIQNVLDHIEAVLYVDIFTGKFEIKLVRGDYDSDEIPELNESNVQKISSYSRKSAEELVNTVTVNYIDVDNLGKKQSITVHNLGLLYEQGSQIISSDKNYNGITKHELANKVATRDLLNLSSELSTVMLTGDRSLMFLKPGDVFKLSYEAYGIESEIMRISEIDYGKLEDGLVSINATQDLYGLSDSVYSNPSTTRWRDPISYPDIAQHRYLYEASYPDWIYIIGSADYSWDEFDDDSSLALFIAASPSGTSMEYDLYTKTDKYRFRETFSFSPGAVLQWKLKKEVYSTVRCEAGRNIESVESETYCIIEGENGVEFCEVISLDVEKRLVELKRGVFDTVPQEHAVGTKIWFCGFDFSANDEVEYVIDDIVRVKCVTKTPKGELPLDEAPEDSLTMRGRMIRPYPPGNFKINDDHYPDYIVGDSCDLSWSHRNRVSQEDNFIAQDEGDISPEEGTTYQLIIYDEDDNEVVNEEGLTDTSYSYSIEQEIDDLGKDRPNEEMRVVIKSYRDDYESWNNQDHTFEGHGYGMFYGDNYGE